MPSRKLSRSHREDVALSPRLAALLDSTAQSPLMSWRRRTDRRGLPHRSPWVQKDPAKRWQSKGVLSGAALLGRHQITATAEAPAQARRHRHGAGNRSRNCVSALEGCALPTELFPRSVQSSSEQFEARRPGSDLQDVSPGHPSRAVCCLPRSRVGLRWAQSIGARCGSSRRPCARARRTWWRHARETRSHCPAGPRRPRR